MARTRKGKKSVGYDYWSRRPMSGSGFGKAIKKLCNRIERALAKRALKKEKDTDHD